MRKDKKSYKSSKKQVSKTGSSTYAHGRTVTAYKYFDLEGKVRAGPHTSSHVFTKVNVERLARNETIGDYRVLLGSRLVPSPGKANAILKEGLAKTGRLASTAVERRKYLLQYTRLYNKLVTSTSRNAQIKLVARIIEAGPQQTYRWAEGSYTADQIAGKGENSRQAELDSATLRDFSASLTYDSLSGRATVSALERWRREGGFNSIDYDAGSQSQEDLRRVVRRSAQLANAAEADGHDWETMSNVSHESDLDFLSRSGAGLYFPKGPARK